MFIEGNLRTAQVIFSIIIAGDPRLLFRSSMHTQSEVGHFSLPKQATIVEGRERAHHYFSAWEGEMSLFSLCSGHESNGFGMCVGIVFRRKRKL